MIQIQTVDCPNCEIGKGSISIIHNQLLGKTNCNTCNYPSDKLAKYYKPTTRTKIKTEKRYIDLMLQKGKDSEIK